MNEEEMKAMKLHETFIIDSLKDILRVPNGWVYGTPSGSVFVPEVLPIIQHIEPRK